MIEAYPLYWPEGQPRATSRRWARFEVGFGRARDEMLHELRMMGAREVKVSTNVPLRKDGLPRMEDKEPQDPGVAVYFLQGKTDRQLVIACDSYTKVRWNMRACGATVAALRSIQRHGATELLERAFTGFAALPPIGGEVLPWWDVLGVPATTNLDGARAAYHELARIHHPDAGGNAESFSRIARAFASAEEALDGH